MRYEQPQFWPNELDPDWGDLPEDDLTPLEQRLFEDHAWAAFKALDTAANDGTSTGNQDGEHRSSRAVIHLLAGALYAGCRVRDRRAGLG